MSNALIKLIDISLFPAALMVTGKVLGLVITITLFNLPWTVKSLPSQLFAIRPALFNDDVVIASSYSDLVMYAILAIGFSFILIQATHFHDTHIKPSLLVKLSNHNLMGLLKSSYDIYHTATVWLIVLWMATVTIGVNVIAQKTYLWVGAGALFATVIFTALILQDVYREVEISRKNLGNQQAF